MNTAASPTVDLLGAADLLKVHPKTVQDLIKCGALPAARVGRSYVLMTRDVLGHIEAAIIAQTAQRLGKTAKATKSATTTDRPGRSRAGSRNASSSGATCAR